VEVPHSDSISITDPLTLEAFVYTLEPTGWLEVITCKGPAFAELYQMERVLGTYTLRYLVTGPDGRRRTDSLSDFLELRKWVHAVIVHERPYVYFYKNGEFNVRRDFNYRVGTAIQNLKIGTRETTDFFRGNIALVRIYNRALTQEEITTLYEIGKKVLGIE